MSKITDNEAFARLNQSWLASQGHGVIVDGWAGGQTADAWRAETGFVEAPGPETGAWPQSDERSLIDFYGEPGESHLVLVRAPYPMRLSRDHSKTATRIRCHRKVAESVTSCLEQILELYGDLGAVREARMDLYGGMYKKRPVREGRAWSLHAWGAAIDLDTKRNGLHTPWPEVATMPVEVVEIFEGAGWLSGGRAWGRDAMHFQATG